jgi:drug/metabolite transporter (DMT)-like permease
MNTSGNATLKYLMLMLGILCIAWSAIFVKLSEVSGLSSAFYRMLIGSLGVIPFWLLYRKPIFDKKSVWIAILCGVFFAIDIAMWNTSIVLSKASIATILGNLAPVWVGFGALFLLKEKPGKIFWAGTGIALFGTAMIIGLSNVSEISFTKGQFLAIIASMFYGAYLLTVRKGRSSLDTFSFTTISMFTSTIVLFVICLIFGTDLKVSSVQSWMSLAGLGLISQLGGWLTINYALAYIKPTVASVSLLGQSVFTALFSLPVLGEYMTSTEMIGGAVVLTGIYLVNTKAMAKKAGK